MSVLTKTLPALKYFRVDDITGHGHKFIITGTAKKGSARRPVWDRRARRIHGWYVRPGSDFPRAGSAVPLPLRVRRFFCSVRSCPRRIFAGRSPDCVAPRGRRAPPLRAALRPIGLAVGGEGGARLARRLGRPGGPSSLLQLIRHLRLPDPGPPHAVGLGEWAWRRGARHGTLLVGLGRHRPIARLPERDADLAAAGLATQPHLATMARDRPDPFAKAAPRGAPQAAHVAERFHLRRNWARRSKLSASANARCSRRRPPL